ncbi:MAG: hypothetical protein JWN25_2536 [Verrucomicrobiales bacterium]|nr:hypothetical protein [Verrucomicrobiales bacterium]
MEEPEVPTEHLHEEMHSHAHSSGKAWIMWVALSSALLAAFAAVTSLLAGHHANEAMADQIKAGNHWSYFQAKSIKENLLVTKIELLEGLGKARQDKDLAKLKEYARDKEEIQALAREKEEDAHHHLESHVIFARGVTMLQVAIAIGAISVLTHKKKFWFFSLFLGLVGVVFFTQGMIYSTQKVEHKPEIHAKPAAETPPTHS